jgi:hypothetical protein
MGESATVAVTVNEFFYGEAPSSGKQNTRSTGQVLLGSLVLVHLFTIEHFGKGLGGGQGMSALGHKRTFAVRNAMSALPPMATDAQSKQHHDH